MSRLLTGAPPEPLLIALTIETVVFAALVGLWPRRPVWVAVVPAYLVALGVAAGMAALIPGIAAIDVAATLGTGWPGLLVLCAIGVLVGRIDR